MQEPRDGKAQQLKDKVLQQAALFRVAMSPTA
jgi:hypothetical protein